MTTEARDIQKRVLPNGLVVLTETMSHVRSVSVGVWISNGSRREVPEENGLAHFMEHMSFNGSKNVPEGEYVKLLQRRGLQFGPHTNASRSRQSPHRSSSCPGVTRPCSPVCRSCRR